MKKFLVLIVLFTLSAFTFSQKTSTLEAAYSKSYEAEQTKNYTTAIANLKSIYTSDSYLANIRLGWLYYLAKDYSQSIKFYKIAISLKPYAIEAKFGSVKPLSATENWDQVKEQYIQILKIDPQNTVANYWLSLIYYNRKDYLNAAKLLEKVVNLYPLDYDSVILLGWTYLNLNKTTEAKVLFNQALIIRPKDSSALTGLSKIK